RSAATRDPGLEPLRMPGSFVRGSSACRARDPSLSLGMTRKGTGTSPAPGVVARGVASSLCTLDRAAKSFGLGLGDRLARDQRVDRILQVGRGDFGGVFVILVDASVVTDLAVLVDDEDFGGALGVVEVGDLVVRVLQ